MGGKVSYLWEAGDIWNRDDKLESLGRKWGIISRTFKHAITQKQITGEERLALEEVFTLIGNVRKGYLEQRTELPGEYHKYDANDVVILSTVAHEGRQIIRESRDDAIISETREILQGVCELFEVICIWCNNYRVRKV
jgi:hypothetical protein